MQPTQIKAFGVIRMEFAPLETIKVLHCDVLNPISGKGLTKRHYSSLVGLV